MTTAILDAAISVCWAIEQHYIEERILPIAAREHEITPEALQAYRDRTLEKADLATARNGVAILGVDGPLFRHANLMTEMSGASSYDVLRRDLQAAVDNPSIRGILLNINSPGGEVNGAGELAKAIRAASAIKPLQAYVGGNGTSAAYWLAAAAPRIVVDDSAALGSIGVVGVVADSSERDAKSGIKRHQFVSSQSPHKRPDLATESGRNRIQMRVDALAKVMIASIADFRGVPADKVVSDFGGGDVLTGADAVSAGLADAVGTFESTLADVIAMASKPVSSPSRIPIRATTGATMTTKTEGQPAAEHAGITADDHEAAVAKARIDGASEALTAANARVKAILGSEQAVGREALAQHLAFETPAMTADAAIGVLQASPKSEGKAPPRLFAGAVPQPKVDAGEGASAHHVPIDTAAIYRERAKARETRITKLN